MGSEKKRRWGGIYLAVLLATFSYAYLRYVLVGPYGIEDAPVFILNKAVSLSIILVLVFRNLFKQGDDEGFQFINLALMGHILLSLFAFNPVYFQKFFIEGKMNFSGQMLIATGVIAYLLTLLKKPVWKHLFFLSLMLHLIFRGWEGWLRPGEWHGSLPPISLISFVCVVFLYIRNFRQHNGQPRCCGSSNTTK